ncbi:hypothetical protein A5634_19815 [Mycobacterium asiaticum]|uniref:Uncharacterized protein n=1 Tax=Mycobacterium asiaticum TaxID=1790 RepID=A0A1A3P5D6_MYCAS|nr:hypothetical protein A5634_19815 [Mycobacterium asiaticum]
MRFRSDIEVDGQDPQRHAKNAPGEATSFYYSSEDDQESSGSDPSGSILPDAFHTQYLIDAHFVTDETARVQIIDELDRAEHDHQRWVYNIAVRVLGVERANAILDDYDQRLQRWRLGGARIVALRDGTVGRFFDDFNVIVRTR